MSASVLYMPMWNRGRNTEFKVYLPYEFRKCGGSGFRVGFQQPNGTTDWKPDFNGEQFDSEPELAAAVRRRSSTVEVHAPGSMPVVHLYRVLRELERANLEVVVFNLKR